AHAHAVRAQVDAIAVGTGTALADDPALTARDANGGLSAHQPLRVVLGAREIPATARLHGPGGELVQLATHDVAEALHELGRREVRHLLVEGGPTLSAALLRAGLVDEVHAYLAPVLLGTGPGAVGPLGISTITEALRLETVSTEPLGPDVLVVARTLTSDRTTARTPTEES
uniref:RibD family protein n=1 Tax=Actinotalea sp. C106 TaxID=2908644 RepID=UPI002028EB08